MARGKPAARNPAEKAGLGRRVLAVLLATVAALTFSGGANSGNEDPHDKR